MARKTNTPKAQRATNTKAKPTTAANVEELRASAVEAPVLENPAKAPSAPRDSIRRAIREGLLAGTSKKDLTAMIQEKFPASKAAAKASTHIAYYTSQLRKEGLLPKKA